MAKRSDSDKAVGEMMPDEVNAVKALVKEFMQKISDIENEVEHLKEDRKGVIEDYSEKLDMKTLQLALRVLKLESKVAHRDAYDLFIEALKDPAQ